MSDHISKQYDSELEAVRNKVLQMGGLVEQQISKAVEALDTGDLALVNAVVSGDAHVNRLEVEIDEACTQMIARRQPAAGDLRVIHTIMRMITDLERIGDEAVKISRMAQAISEANRAHLPRVELKHLENTAIGMLRRALDAYARLDVQGATAVVREDEAVDVEYASIVRQLITHMMEDPRTISRAIELLFVSKALERIGDHSKNMCEYVIYMVKGRDVRHLAIEEFEQSVQRD
ncbi:phosphate signaling complex protein PhoU [Derxia gummosa]|uniref:Phosphate-specific transport system accessory protein PhoU n=1 Tax=Derxia gummosa DSM 723 TaxID=1121388 RepID=A0A8B6X653_9BURK|nr:phosphate signaling complex protein PhoU [Derxia gummosa]